jgi:hypothetical protein
MSEISRHGDYRQVLESIKQCIQASQTRAVLGQMALHLQAVYLGMKGFSRTSLFAMRQFYAFFSPLFEFVPQAVGQMPWGHVRILLDKANSLRNTGKLSNDRL